MTFWTFFHIRVFDQFFMCELFKFFSVWAFDQFSSPDLFTTFHTDFLNISSFMSILKVFHIWAFEPICRVWAFEQFFISEHLIIFSYLTSWTDLLSSWSLNSYMDLDANFMYFNFGWLFCCFKRNLLADTNRRTSSSK